MSKYYINLSYVSNACESDFHKHLLYMKKNNNTDLEIIEWICLEYHKEFIKAISYYNISYEVLFESDKIFEYVCNNIPLLFKRVPSLSHNENYLVNGSFIDLKIEQVLTLLNLKIISGVNDPIIYEILQTYTINNDVLDWLLSNNLNVSIYTLINIISTIQSISTCLNYVKSNQHHFNLVMAGLIRQSLINRSDECINYIFANICWESVIKYLNDYIDQDIKNMIVSISDIPVNSLANVLNVFVTNNKIATNISDLYNKLKEYIDNVSFYYLMYEYQIWSNQYRLSCCPLIG